MHVSVLSAVQIAVTAAQMAWMISGFTRLPGRWLRWKMSPAAAGTTGSTVKSAVRRVRTWITPEVGAPASARRGALDCGSAIGKVLLPDR